jgi:hypothetical protein
MRRSIFGTLLAFGLLGGACAEDIPEILVVSNQPLDDQCQPSTAGNRVLGRGRLDLFITQSGYEMAPLVQNVMVPSDSIQFQGLAAGLGGLVGTDWEANRVTLQRVVARYEGPSALGVPLPSELPIDLGLTLDPNATAAVSINVISPNIATVLRSSPLLRPPGSSVTILVTLKFFGRTSSGLQVDSNEFTYPVEVCNGCLLQYPIEAIDPTFPTPNCRNTEGFESTNSDIPCRVGQDEPVDCRLVCPLLSGDAQRDPNGFCTPVQ